MSSLILKSPAKLNLVLDILGQRPDGFHQLQTIFERIDLSDTIRLTLRSDGLIKVICVNSQVPKDASNIVVKIARLLQNDFKITQGVTIHITKRIPVAAGLAGGSSNGATVLMGLNRLWELGLSQKQLKSYADQVGSDVTFFIYDTSYALGLERGEQITPLKIRTKLWHVLVTPRFKLLTKDVFSRLRQDYGGQARAGLKMALTNKKDNVNILLPYLRKNMPLSIGQTLSNDLESAILSLRPELGRVKEKLRKAGACGVCFSGSGPSVFALAESEKHAQHIKACFDKRFVQVFVVSTF